MDGENHLNANPAAPLPGPESEAVELRPLLVFRVAAGWFGVDAAAVVEVADLEEPVPIPRCPAHVPGLIFLRGNAVPLLDLARFLDLEPAAAGTAAISEDEELRPERVVVVAAEDMKVGIRSPWVRGVFDVPAARFLPPEALGEEVRRFADAQVDHEVGLLAVLDLPELLEAARPEAAPPKTARPEAAPPEPGDE